MDLLITGTPLCPNHMLYELEMHQTICDDSTIHNHNIYLALRKQTAYGNCSSLEKYNTSIVIKTGLQYSSNDKNALPDSILNDVTSQRMVLLPVMKLLVAPSDAGAAVGTIGHTASCASSSEEMSHSSIGSSPFGHPQSTNLNSNVPPTNSPVTNIQENLSNRYLTQAQFGIIKRSTYLRN